MRTQAISKPRGEGPSPPFSTAPRVLPCGPLPWPEPALGWSSLEDSYLSLANWPSSGPSRVKWAGFGTPAREISFVSLVAYGPNSDSALTMGGYSLWNQARWFPIRGKFSIFVSKAVQLLWKCCTSPSSFIQCLGPILSTPKEYSNWFPKSIMCLH